MTTTVTKESLAARIAELESGARSLKEDYTLAAYKMLLATMEAEPVAWTDEQELRDVDRGGCGYLFTVNPVTPHADERRIILLYRHAQPTPVVPDEVRRCLGFFASVIKCGEQWTSVCQHEYDTALAALNNQK